MRLVSVDLPKFLSAVTIAMAPLSKQRQVQVALEY